MTPLPLALLALAPAAHAGRTLGSDELGARDPVDLPDPADLAPDAPATPYIINGEAATRDDWPMTGGLLVRADVDRGGALIEQTALLCSSTLIAPDVVLLAAHCVDLDPILQQMGLGGITLENLEFYWSTRVDLSEYQLGAPPADLPGDAVKAVAHIMHPSWDFFQLQLGLAENDDIALLFLETPILDLPLGYLPVADTDETQLAVDDEVAVVGWGQQTATPQGQQPPPGTVGIKRMGMSHVERREAYEFQVGAVVADVRKCHGDSGGPSFKMVETDSSEPWRVVGVTSHAYDLSDCSMTGGVDTRVSHYLAWIDETMRAGCADGTRSWCEIEGILPPPLPDGTLAWEIPEEEEKKGCGCRSAGAGAAGWLALVGVAIARRRR